MGNNIFDASVGALNTSLNLRLVNQNLIASNIANADTPGYKAKAIEFERALRDALAISDQMPMMETNPNHMIHI